MLKNRQKALLYAIIQEHIQTAEPIGSSLLVDKYRFNLSTATIRHEMNTLEKEGYLLKPHTSAGRVPTEKAWHYYLENFLKAKNLSTQEMRLLEKTVAKYRKSYEDLFKKLAHTLADLSREAVIVAFSANNVYYTGLANLFQQPEFSQIDLIHNISAIVDHLDEVIAQIFKEIQEQPKILIGRENPFGKECGVILMRYKLRDYYKGIFGILGPIRQYYDYNLALLNYSCGLLTKFIK